MRNFVVVVEYKASKNKKDADILYNIYEKRYPVNGMVEFLTEDGDSYVYSLDTIRTFSMEREEVGEETDAVTN